jgi:uncharacterized damage-inducible protein DinB
METLATIKRLFEYDAWANMTALASLRSASAPPERAVAVLAHVAGAQQLWLSRIRGEQPKSPPWPDLGLDQLEEKLKDLAKQWSSYVGRLAYEDLARNVTYTNSKGDTFTSSVGDVLLQLLCHGAYHRGQVALLLREAGQQPVNTDYIHAARKGLIS